MESRPSSQFAKIKSLLDARANFLDEVREIIYQVSGVNLREKEIEWRAATLTLIIKTSPVAKNLIFRHREKILTAFSAHFDRQAPKFIR